GVDRIGFPDIGEILVRRLARPVAWRGAEPFAEFIRRSADGLALRHGRDLLVVSERNIRRRCRQRRAAGGAELAATVDLDGEHVIAFVSGGFGGLAVIDRLDEARLDQTAFEESAAP